MSTAVSLANVNHIPAKADVSVRFTDDQYRLIRETCCGGASKSDADVLVAIAEARGLNPILGECYFVERWDSQAGKKKWAVQASIDAFRIKAEQTGLYAGQDEPEFEYDSDGRVVLARVRVYRKDWPRPAVGVARWSEYVQTTKDNVPTKFWKQMPHNQLAKCAEALALRKAFPAVLAKIYTVDEMQQADNVETYRAEPVAPAPKQLAPVDERAFSSLCDRVDAAENAAALNAIAKDAQRAAKDGAITQGNLEALKGAVTRKRELIGGAKAVPPKSAPRMPEREPGDDTDDIDASAMNGGLE